jgi:hypothetical protein
MPPGKQALGATRCGAGKWAFTLGDSADGSSVVLDVDVGRFLDTSLILADVQPSFVRLLIKGRLLQLLLPQEVICFRMPRLPAACLALAFCPAHPVLASWPLQQLLPPGGMCPGCLLPAWPCF